MYRELNKPKSRKEGREVCTCVEFVFHKWRPEGDVVTYGRMEDPRLLGHVGKSSSHLHLAPDEAQVAEEKRDERGLPATHASAYPDQSAVAKPCLSAQLLVDRISPRSRAIYRKNLVR